MLPYAGDSRNFPSLWIFFEENFFLQFTERFKVIRVVVDDFHHIIFLKVIDDCEVFGNGSEVCRFSPNDAGIAENVIRNLFFINLNDFFEFLFAVEPHALFSVSVDF